MEEQTNKQQKRETLALTVRQADSRPKGAEQ